MVKLEYLDQDLHTLDQFLHIKKSVLSYNLDTAHDAPMKPNADAAGLIRDAVAVADRLVDFSKYQFKFFNCSPINLKAACQLIDTMCYGWACAQVIRATAAI